MGLPSYTRNSLFAYLISESPCEVVGAELRGGNEAEPDQIFRELKETRVMPTQVVDVAGELVVGIGHDDDVPALLNRHVLIIASNMARGVGEVRPDVVHAIPMRVEPSLLHLPYRLQQVSQQRRVGVQEERRYWI